MNVDNNIRLKDLLIIIPNSFPRGSPVGTPRRNSLRRSPGDFSPGSEAPRGDDFKIKNFKNFPQGRAEGPPEGKTPRAVGPGVLGALPKIINIIFIKI
jgi:hypothetical protein